MKVDFQIKPVGHWISWVISFTAQWVNSTKWIFISDPASGSTPRKSQLKKHKTYTVTWNRYWFASEFRWINQNKTISGNNFRRFLLLEPRMPSLSSGFPWVTPPKSLSTMKAVILSFTCPSLSTTSVLANTVKMLARPPLEIQTCLERGKMCKKCNCADFVSTVPKGFVIGWAKHRVLKNCCSFLQL